MKQGLSNPALIALASTPAGQEASKGAVNLGFTILKFGIIGVASYLIYKRISKNFDIQKESKKTKASNISEADARQRANEIFRAMYGFGANYKKTLNALMISKTQPVNYNGFVRIFNAFGTKKGADFEPMNLTEWLYNQFNSEEIAMLKIATKLNF